MSQSTNQATNQPMSPRKKRMRERIVASAAKLFRKRGLDATGVDAVMKDVGLTVGGFYSYFESKEHLIQLALEQALSDSRLRLEAAAQKHPESPLQGLLDMYLSEAHRDHPAQGCVFAALAGEISRQPEATLNLLTAYLENWFRYLEKGKIQREEALRTVAMAVGALLLSRMTKGSGLSSELLAAGRNAKIND